MRVDVSDAGGPDGEAPAHEPFAAVLGCSDARVPAELVLGCAAGDLFIVRVAGNVPGAWSIGSVGFAVERLETIRLLAVIGHTGCGAVTAAVDACLAPETYLGVAAQLPLRTIVDSLLPAVVCARAALEAVHGPGASSRPGSAAALTELSVVLNAALTANVLRQRFAGRMGEALDVVYGVYNLRTRVVGVPCAGAEGGWTPALVHPPAAEPDVIALGRDLARTPFIADLLGN